jgi:hypothetical protein
LGEGTGEVIFEDKLAYAGKVTEQHINISFDTPNGKFTFYSELYIPNGVEKPPVFLNHVFRRVPDRYIPVEEITESFITDFYNNVKANKGNTVLRITVSSREDGVNLNLFSKRYKIAMTSEFVSYLDSNEFKYSLS